MAGNDRVGITSAVKHRLSDVHICCLARGLTKELENPACASLCMGLVVI